MSDNITWEYFSSELHSLVSDFMEDMISLMVPYKHTMTEQANASELSAHDTLIIRKEKFESDALALLDDYQSDCSEYACFMSMQLYISKIRDAATAILSYYEIVSKWPQWINTSHPDPIFLSQEDRHAYNAIYGSSNSSKETLSMKCKNSFYERNFDGVDEMFRDSSK